MFTGIVIAIGEITSKKESDKGIEFSIDTKLDESESIQDGDSIAVSGACLTVTAHRGSEVDVYVSERSLSDTGFSDMKVGSLVNIERPLTLKDGLGGHMVTGHVDGLAICASRQLSGASIELAFTVSGDLSIGHYLVEQGSVAVDGVSLTVKNIADHEFGTDFFVNVIPYTQMTTTLGNLAVGDAVHIEVDLVARHVERLLVSYLDANTND